MSGNDIINFIKATENGDGLPITVLHIDETESYGVRTANDYCDRKNYWPTDNTGGY